MYLELCLGTFLTIITTIFVLGICNDNIGS